MPRILLIIILSYLLYRILSRYILPYFVHKSLRNYQEKFNQTNPDAADRNRREGRIKIKRVGKTDPTYTKDPDMGEYVDFEDVKEK